MLGHYTNLLVKTCQFSYVFNEITDNYATNGN